MSKADGIDRLSELSLSADSCVEVIPDVGSPLLAPIDTFHKNEDGDMTSNDGDRGALRDKTRTQESIKGLQQLISGDLENSCCLVGLALWLFA